MVGIVRMGMIRFSNNTGVKSILLRKQQLNSIRPISSKVTRTLENRPPRPPPFNYKWVLYNQITHFYDTTSKRMDENSKVIVVEGPIAAGKTKFAKELAEQLDMFYFPEANLDMVYINDYGFDKRTLDDQLPEPCRSFDVTNFLLTPKHMNAASFQVHQYYTKYSQYVDALAYLLNSGQGVVLDRCCFSDFVFLEAMFSQGYISKPAYKAYYEIRDNSISQLVRPHLIIYLDVPVNKVQENIKKRAYNCEKNSQVLTPAYLSVIEKFYKQSYLKDISTHTELLVYDWSEGGEVEIVVEDIEKIDFSQSNDQDARLKDWDFRSESDWSLIRYLCSRKYKMLANLNVPLHHVPELSVQGEDAKIYHDVMNNAPGEHFIEGYNASMGDTGIIFKSKRPQELLPLRERILS